MRVSLRMRARALAIAALVLSFGCAVQAQSQDHDHVVRLGDLKKDAAAPAETRQANEAALRGLLSSETGQKAMKSAGLDYQQVDHAVSRLDDEELAKLSERARQAQTDFAAGRISDRDLLWIIVIVLAIVVIAIAVR